MESQIQEIRRILQSEHYHLNELEIETIELRRRLNEDRDEQWRRFETVEAKRRNQLLKLEEENHILRGEVLNLTECCETFQSINYTQRRTIEDLMSRIAEMQSKGHNESDQIEFSKTKCACRDVNIENSECCQAQEINEELWIIVDDLMTIIAEMEEKIFQQKECLEARIGVLEQKVVKTANSLFVLVESSLLRLSRSVSPEPSSQNFSPYGSIISSIASLEDYRDSTMFPKSILCKNEIGHVLRNEQEPHDNPLSNDLSPYHHTQLYNLHPSDELITKSLPNYFYQSQLTPFPPSPFPEVASVTVVSSQAFHPRHQPSISSGSSSCESQETVVTSPSSYSPTPFPTQHSLHYLPTSQATAPSLSAPPSPTRTSHDQRKYHRYSLHL